MALSLFASIGVGFVISLASASDAQAVQYTMILLLASLFFSGFFLSVGQMEGRGEVLAAAAGELRDAAAARRDAARRQPRSQLGRRPHRLRIAMFVLALLGTRRRLAVDSMTGTERFARKESWEHHEADSTTQDRHGDDRHRVPSASS